MNFPLKDIVFGPIRSRRLGMSLGINLLPTDRKICTFDCLYCECGWTYEEVDVHKNFYSRDEIRLTLEKKLLEIIEEGIIPDSITFSGNGEPTLHRDFDLIIDDTIALRNKYFPKTIISVFSNSTMLHKEKVVSSLKKVDQCILKIDASNESDYRLINRVKSDYTLEKTIQLIKQFEGKFIMQSMFLRGHYKDEVVDNTQEEKVDKWVEIVKELHPEKVMIYSLDRDTPARYLEQVPLEELEVIAAKVRSVGVDADAY